MTKYHDEDACEAFEDGVQAREPAAAEDEIREAFEAGWKYGATAKEREAREQGECVPIEGRMLLSGTPQKIGVMLAQFLGTERIRCTIEWSADWERF